MPELTFSLIFGDALSPVFVGRPSQRAASGKVGCALEEAHGSVRRPQLRLLTWDHAAGPGASSTVLTTWPQMASGHSMLKAWDVPILCRTEED